MLLSHELRTPLQAMLGWVQILRTRGNGDATIASGLDAIERNIRLQAQVIDELLEMAEILSSTFALESRSIRLSPLLDAAMEAISPTATTKEIHLERNTPGEDEEILVDPERLQRVIQILLVQALEFTAPGGTIQVDVRRAGPFLQIVITDWSSGHDPMAAPVFDEFRHGPPSSTTEFGPLGIGLSNAQKLVEIHGGGLRAESAGFGHGATFTISLPRSG